MTAVLENSITEEQKQQLEREGYFVARGLFSPEEIAAIRETFMEQAKDGPVPGLSEFKHHNQEYDPSDPLAFYPRMMNPHGHTDKEIGQTARTYMLDRRLYPFLEATLSEEPIAVQTMFYFKPPGARGQDLHQDNFYLRVSPGTCVAAWLAVDDADEENGGMVVVPQSDNLDIVCPEKSDPTIFFTTEHVSVPEGMREMPVTLKAGDVLFFNGSIIHGSYPNTSKTRFRRSLIAHYVPRFSQELAHWYRTPTTFDGEVISIAEAIGGGPCGTLQASMAPH